MALSINVSLSLVMPLKKHIQIPPTEGMLRVLFSYCDKSYCSCSTLKGSPICSSHSVLNERYLGSDKESGCVNCLRGSFKTQPPVDRGLGFETVPKLLFAQCKRKARTKNMKIRPGTDCVFVLLTQLQAHYATSDLSPDKRIQIGLTSFKTIIESLIAVNV